MTGKNTLVIPSRGDLFHAMEAEKPPLIDGKGLKNRLSRQNRPNRGICYQFATKTEQVGGRADCGGSALSFMHQIVV